MVSLFTNTSGVTYDLETDWIDMMDYSERVIDMVTSIDITSLVTTGSTGAMDPTFGLQV